VSSAHRRDYRSLHATCTYTVVILRPLLRPCRCNLLWSYCIIERHGFHSHCNATAFKVHTGYIHTILDTCCIHIATCRGTDATYTFSELRSFTLHTLCIKSQGVLLAAFVAFFVTRVTRGSYAMRLQLTRAWTARSMNLKDGMQAQGTEST
jgi:hypothetical protein